jgi:Tol biopolymer transport system component
LFGPAANGLILYGTTAGNIASVDVASGAIATVLGDVRELGGWMPDGTRFIFERTVAGRPAMWIADSDGTNARQLLDPATSAGWGWIEWAPDSRRILMVPAYGGDATILDIDSGARSTLHAPVPIRMASWLADGRVLVVSGGVDRADAVFATIAEDGTGYAVLPTTDAIEHYSISGDGTRFAYDTWGSAAGTEGLIHVFDLTTGKDRLLTKPDVNFSNLLPVFSPDDRWVAVDRYDVVGSKIVLLPADGEGRPVELGPQHKGDVGEASVNWAPDASALIATYPQTGESWMFDVATASGGKVDWPGLGDRVSWQRVAP